jgi:hypothetical protein
LEIQGGNMTRTNSFSLLTSAALLAAMGAFGCGGGSTINGTGGTSGGLGGRGGSGTVIIGTGGGSGGLGGAPGTDGGLNSCVNNAACAAGFTCDQTCNVGGVAGTRSCTCGNNRQLVCTAGNAGCLRPPVDAGFNMCTANTPCTDGFACQQACNVGGITGTRACTCPAGGGMLNCPAGNAGCTLPIDSCVVGSRCNAAFTCAMNCNVNGQAGMRSCTCDATGMVVCPAGNAGCSVPDAGFNMCTANFPCTAGYACEQACNVGGVAGMRACTCPAAGGMLNCPGGNNACIRPMPDGGAPVDARPPVDVRPADAPVDRPPG